ncbi:hypothetical protein EUTSA_v10011093mg, partial [Eutrema salsugineum]
SYFKQTLIGSVLRRFNSAWFDQYPNWLEYSVKKDAAFCLCCYLFKDNAGKVAKNDVWTTDGFSSWNKLKNISENQGQSIKHALHKQDDITKNEYQIRLNASIDASRFLLQQGLSFRGHEEKEETANNGNFVELLKYTAEQSKVVSKVILKNAFGNNQMTSPKIHKDIVHCFAEEVVKTIIEEIDHDVFSFLVDESADVSYKEQMAVVFRFVDKSEIVKERFISITHVIDTSSTSLKDAFDSVFAKYVLSIKNVGRHGYDRASNMNVAVAKKHFGVGDFFDMISLFLNVVGASSKRKDMFRESHRETIEKVVNDGERNTGKGLNQDVSLQRPENTRWGSHNRTLLLLECVQNNGIEDSKICQAHGLLRYFNSFDFVFYLHLIVHLLGLTDSLYTALQKRDQEILNAMSLVTSTKRQLQKFRDDGWNSLMMKVSSLCKKHAIEELDMEEDFFDQSKLMRLSKFYPSDFSSGECISLEQQLDIYIDNVQSDEKFTHYKILENLLVFYRLLKLILIFPVAIATVESFFSEMKIVKTD